MLALMGGSPGLAALSCQSGPWAGAGTEPGEEVELGLAQARINLGRAERHKERSDEERS